MGSETHHASSIQIIGTFTGATPEALQGIAREKELRKTNEVFLLFAMGSQFDHLIKLMLERLGVFCLVADPSRVSADDVWKLSPVGVVVSGGPASVHSEAPPFDNEIFDLGIPVLGVCLGFQMWAKHRGLKVTPAGKREFSTHSAEVTPVGLLRGVSTPTRVLQSHGDRVEPDDTLTILAQTDNSPVAAASLDHLYGVQFHPEVSETVEGQRIFENFCFEICRAEDRYPALSVAEQKIIALRERVGAGRVAVALSAGCDSSVVAYLLRRAVDEQPGRLFGIYIKGLDRQDDEAHLHEYFGKQPWITVRVIDATDRFLKVLHGAKTMEEKRAAMKYDAYQAILAEAIKDIGGIDFFAQGTLYTDISESGGGYDSGARKARIKDHHNVGIDVGVPELMPLADCVKDGARAIGRAIGVPEELLQRHPFPGPGLAVRIENEITAEKLAIERQVDGIYIEEMRNWNLYDSIWQAGVFLQNSWTTCTKGDDAGSGYVVELFAVWSVNGFTAESAEVRWDFLKHVSRRITNEVSEVGGVVYRISDKPPMTIERG